MAVTPIPSSAYGAWHSNAKVNLCLRVVGRRDDGYHLLDSIFAPIALYDRVSIAVRDATRGAATTIVVRCAYPGVPEDGTNLVAKAAIAILTEAGVGAHVTIELDKQIPPGSGVGGGSGNAGTVLLAMNELLALGVPADRLHALGLKIGADVPFFLQGGCARVRGIGEQLERIPGWPDLALVVALPPVSVSTIWAFKNYPRGEYAGGDEPARMAAGVPTPELLVNDLERVVLPEYPVVAAAKQALLAAGATGAVMSGSGAAVLGLAPSLDAARTIAAAAERSMPDTEFHPVTVLTDDLALRPARTAS